MGGAVIAPFERATIIIINEPGLRIAVKPEHRAAVQQASVRQVVVSIDWVVQCIEADQIVINFAHFQIKMAPTISEPLVDDHAPATLEADQIIMVSDDPLTSAYAPSNGLASGRPIAKRRQTELPVGQQQIDLGPLEGDASDEEDDIVWVKTETVVKPSGRQITRTTSKPPSGLHTPPRTPSLSHLDPKPHNAMDWMERSMSALTTITLEGDDDIFGDPRLSTAARSAVHRMDAVEDMDDFSEDDDDFDNKNGNAVAGASQTNRTRRDQAPRQQREVVQLDLVTNPTEINRIIDRTVGQAPDQVSRFNVLWDELELWKEGGFQGRFKHFFQRVAQKVRDFATGEGGCRPDSISTQWSPKISGGMRGDNGRCCTINSSRTCCTRVTRN